MKEFLTDFGRILENQDPDSLKIAAAQKTVLAIKNNPDFNLVELRYTQTEGLYSEIIVVECTNDGVFTDNRVGIKFRERLALRFWEDSEISPEVRALRRDFPVTPHQNHVNPGEPSSLCINVDHWATVQRSWTPEKHLKRILWWLAEAANESLHQHDQPVEPVYFYFHSAYEIVLPLDFDTKILDQSLSFVVEQRPMRDNPGRMLVGSFQPVTKAIKEGMPQLRSVAVSVPPILHSYIERFPVTLGELNDQLERRGSTLAPLLFQEIAKVAAGVGIPKNENASTLIVIRIPIVRTPESKPERYDSIGFLIEKGLGEIGFAGGVLIKDQEKKMFWKDIKVGEKTPEAIEWRKISVQPIEVIKGFSRDQARVSNGITTSGPKGVLGGVGALGSSIANIFFREGWGKWTLIDPDYLKPHNLARGTTFEGHLGSYKADSIKDLELGIYPSEEATGIPIVERANNFSNQKVAEAVDSAELVIDATATLDVARDLSLRESVKRAITVFVTPDGTGAVLLIEDCGRTSRLDVLEAQYYRSIINQPWGKNHLIEKGGLVRVGAGCRDISAIISNEFIQLHAATLARQIRLKSEETGAFMQVWHISPDTGAVTTEIIPPAKPLPLILNNLKLIWDEGLLEKIRKMREACLPNETGGVLLGYFDLMMGHVYIVDALSAPPDSEGDESGFTRGISGLQEKVRNAEERTRGTVSYIGEWHSHPSNSSTNPSPPDLYLLAHLATELQGDGYPALILIVGDHNENWLIGKIMSVKK